MEQPEYRSEEGGGKMEEGGWFCEAKAVPQAKPLREGRKYKKEEGEEQGVVQERRGS